MNYYDVYLAVSSKNDIYELSPINSNYSKLINELKQPRNWSEFVIKYPDHPLTELLHKKSTRLFELFDPNLKFIIKLDNPYLLLAYCELNRVDLLNYLFLIDEESTTKLKYQLCYSASFHEKGLDLKNSIHLSNIGTLIRYAKMFLSIVEVLEPYTISNIYDKLLAYALKSHDPPVEDIDYITVDLTCKLAFLLRDLKKKLTIEDYCKVFLTLLDKWYQINNDALDMIIEQSLMLVDVTESIEDNIREELASGDKERQLKVLKIFYNLTEEELCKLEWEEIKK